MEETQGSSGTEPQPVAAEPPPSTVDTAAKLIDALNRAAPGDTITLRSQEYRVGVPLLVRDRVTLRGAGEMQFNQGLPTGFKQGTKTTIIGNRDLAGNLMTLSDGSKAEKLVLQGPSRFQEDDAGPIGGNVVAVASRRHDDSVSATIEECELINNVESAGGADGPTGGAILAYTRNPKGATTPPHVNAKITVEVTRSIVHNTHEDGKAAFAMNFASHGNVTINLTKNEIRGPLDVIGGLSRPDAVEDATTTIISHGNHYSPRAASDVEAWHIVGGSSWPFGGNATTNSNSASIQSTNDQIENFQVGIKAVGGRRFSINHGTCSDNTVNLKLTGMKPATNPGTPAEEDFVFIGAQSGGLFRAGANNTVAVEVLAGTDPLFQIDVHDGGFGTGNQLVFKGGTLAAFTQLPTS
jgi:hypothetical protein